MICPGCLKENKEGYCTKCRKELFDSKRVMSMLSFNSPYVEDSELYHDHTKKISISGVQVKYSLRLEKNELILTEKKGQYILKPIPTGTFKHLDQAPINEHLTMQIAKQAYGLNIPANALIYFKDGSLAYLVRRFDQGADGNKYQQEDFAQIAQATSETHGENYKYDFSYEEIAELIKTYIASHRIELEKYFKLILFNYLICNGDAHLKNFSAIQTSQGDYVLTPVYDLLCTKIHTPNESDTSLTLFKDGFSKSYESYGFYTYSDFLLFGKKIGIKESRIINILGAYGQFNELVTYLIDQSFLNDKAKALYKKHYSLRLDRLNMGITDLT